jgi:hypothetical protein
LEAGGGRREEGEGKIDTLQTRRVMIYDMYALVNGLPFFSQSHYASKRKTPKISGKFRVRGVEPHLNASNRLDFI